MKKTYFIAILLIFAFVSNVFTIEPHFMKDLAISPDGKTVCFSYLSDLWTVPFAGGEAKKITATVGNDTDPVYSPDGKRIAFNSNMDGFIGIYVMPADGGDAKCVCKERLAVRDWFKKKSLFGSKNGTLLATGYELGLGRNFYSVPLDGSRPKEITGIGDYHCALSPDNEKLIYQKRGNSYRERYKGSHNGELWEYDLKNNKYTKLTDSDLTECYPVYSSDGKSIFFAATDFIADNEAVYQLYKVTDNDFDNKVQLTDFDVWSVRDINIAKSNDRIVFEKFDEIWKFDPQKNEATKLQIDIKQNILKEFEITKKEKNVASDYAVSPNGKFVVFSNEFDLFAVPIKGGEVKQITQDIQGIEDIAVMPDNKTIYFTKMEKGKPTLYKTVITDLDKIETVKWFKNKHITNLQVSDKENENLIVYFSDDDFRNQIASVDYENDKVKQLLSGKHVVEFRYSPDNNYAFYITIRSGSWDRVLWLKDFENDTDEMILPFHGNLNNILWGEFGNYAFFDKQSKICRIALQPKDDYWDEDDNWKEILEASKDEDNEKDNKNEDTKDEDKGEAEKEEESIQIQVDVEGIRNRIKTISSRSGHNWLVALAPDSIIYYMNTRFQEDSDKRKYVLRKMDFNGENDEEIKSSDSNVGSLTYNKEQDCFYFIESNSLKKLTTGGTVSTVENDFNYSYNEMDLNKKVFENAWETFGWQFYDPNMHGVDWDKMYKRYYPYLRYTYDPVMMDDIMSEMIGQVNGSHTGFYPRKKDDGIKSKRQAFGGFLLDYSKVLKKGIKFKKIYKKSKLNKPYNIKPGDLLLSVDGVKITDKTEIAPLFFDKVGEKIEMDIQTPDSVKHVTIKGLSWGNQYNMHYDNWVSEREGKVEALNNDIGYMHIRSMNWSSYEKFQQDIFAKYYDKKAIIIDVRNNPGGWIHDYLIEVLTKKPYAYTTSRTFNAKKSKFPSDVWDKQVVLLINQNSFSDAEIFPTLFKQFNFGKVIGMPTSGSVIGTWHVNFMDGSSMRMPGSGWFTKDKINMEGRGAEPDIYIDLTPEQKISDDDVQLQKAVEVLMEDL
ncbi:MAG: S41 family peptidase [Candidatus Cloacimonadota bacterium]|nr:S41 family peptidase [Candidatus Cloacimonadota bacterium]